MTVLSVALGGAIGASLRFGVGAWTLRVFGPGFPVGTMVVNVLGSLVMGLVAVAMVQRFPDTLGAYAPFVMTGILGGFTTFSAFSLETLMLAQEGQLDKAVAYAIGTVVVCLGACFFGLFFAKELV